MKLLTVQESAEWLQRRGLQMEPAPQWGHDHFLAIPASFHGFYFDTPQDARRVWSLAHLLTTWFPCESSLLLVCGVFLFKDHELDAFLLSRASSGDTRWVDDVPGGATPGQLFDDGPDRDRRHVREFLSLMMAFTFQGYLVRRDGRLVIWVGDDVIDVEAADEGDLQEAHRIAETLTSAQENGRTSPYARGLPTTTKRPRPDEATARRRDAAYQCSPELGQGG